jgi:hypothetical protein
MLNSIELGALLIAILVLSARPAVGAIEDVEGHYTGYWSNITFFSTGAAVIDIEVTGTSASLTFDMDGGVFGGSDPAQITMPGTVQGDLILIDNQGVGIYGDITGAVDSSAGTLTAALTNIPNEYIQQVSVVGTISNGVMNLDYSVLFPGPLDPYNPAVGIMSVERKSVLTISAISIQGTNVLLEWTGGEPPFTIQSRPDLQQGTWTDAGDSTSSRLFLVPHPPVSNEFFRVTSP